MKHTPGLELLVDEPGTGREAARGDTVTYNIRIFLNRGDEVRLNEQQAAVCPTRVVDGVTLVDHVTTLGKRRVIAGVENALYGMKVGGHRRVRVGPHLAYRDAGVPDLIPANAVLEIEIWLRALA